jgi:hypothetical protein
MGVTISRIVFKSEEKCLAKMQGKKAETKKR